MKPTKPEMIRQAIELRANGFEYTQIAEYFGVSQTTAYRRCHPELRENYNEARRKRHKMRSVRSNKYHEYRPCAADVLARLAEIPLDTRTPGEILMGEPLKGRRAIDRASNGFPCSSLPLLPNDEIVPQRHTGRPEND